MSRAEAQTAIRQRVDDLVKALLGWTSRRKGTPDQAESDPRESVTRQATQHRATLARCIP